MIQLLRPHAALLLACTLLTALLASSPAWSTGAVHAAPATRAAATSTRPPGPTPRATPSPTPSAPDAELAAAFSRQGKLEEAIGAYLAVIEQGAPEERLAAHTALALVYLDDYQVTSAVRELDAYLLEAPAGTDVRAAQFLLAEALTILGDWEGSLPLYDAYVTADGDASIYARMGRAEALARLGRGPEAVAEAERVPFDDLPRSARVGFELSMAQALEASHPKDALAWYGQLRRDSEAPADRALALWRSAQVERDLGDEDAVPKAWATIIQRYPETAIAQAIVDGPPVGIVLDSYYAGLVHYRGGRYQEARRAFNISFEEDRGGPRRSLAASAAYYLAVLDEGAGLLDRAITGYGRVLDLDAGVALADDALWWRGRLLEQAGRPEEAAASYERLASEFGRSEWAPEARFRRALLAYDGGRAQDAANSFADIAGAARGEERQRALLWQGKALSAQGDEDGAEEAWGALRNQAATDFYGLRAAVLLREEGGKLNDAALDEAEEPNWAVIRKWLPGTGDVDTSLALKALLLNRHWELGQELLALGMRHRAGAEFGLLLEEAEKDTAALYQLTRLSHWAGMTHISSRAAAHLLGAVSPEGAEEAPGDLWRLAYPIPFVDVLREAADEAETPDLLLLALIRQESFFDPLAGSSAGALGLTQVIPSTGEAIARDLGIADFDVGDLHRPVVSLRFGAHYLREQLDLFDGNVYYALAAYNAGPGNALRWRSAAGGDVDRFVAEVEFSQTRTYVQLVSENLARYRQLYGDLDEPSLPRD